jgi:hypothetical protein
LSLLIALLWAAGSTAGIACACIGEVEPTAEQQVFVVIDGDLDRPERPDCRDHPAHSQCQSCHAHMVAARTSVTVVSVAISQARADFAENAQVTDTVFNLFRPPRA